MSTKKRMTHIHRDDTISMTRFLVAYCGGFNGIEVDLTHKQLKAMNPAVVKNVPFSKVTMDEIKTGKIILVEDAVGNVAPYLNPKLIKESYKQKAIERERRQMEEDNVQPKRR